jgi:hypothetical protein
MGRAAVRVSVAVRSLIFVIMTVSRGWDADWGECSSRSFGRVRVTRVCRCYGVRVRMGTRNPWLRWPNSSCRRVRCVGGRPRLQVNECAAMGRRRDMILVKAKPRAPLQRRRMRSVANLIGYLHNLRARLSGMDIERGGDGRRPGTVCSRGLGAGRAVAMTATIEKRLPFNFMRGAHLVLSGDGRSGARGMRMGVRVAMAVRVF